jgi:hypothetical protein
VTLGCVLVANHGHEAKLHNATEDVSGNIGAAGVVANVFCENFFATVWSRDASFNGYPRNRVPLLAGYLNYVMDRGLLCKQLLGKRSPSENDFDQTGKQFFHRPDH